jgi:hypothetical protein
MGTEQQVDCGQHGTCGPAFVCRHLVHGVERGFYAANCPNPDDPPDGDSEDCYNGWCEECEQERLRCGGWTDESEAFAGITLVCVRCFDGIRRRNTTGDEVA